MSKPDEIGAAMTDVSKSSDATIQSLNDSNKAAEAFNKLSPEMQKFVIAALATAGIGALKIVEIVKKVQSAKPTPIDCEEGSIC
jgi:Mg/Co/Ni transporter MgtE